MKLNKKVTLGASALVLGATLLGGTMAWLISEETVVNKFSTKSWDLDVEIDEKFDEDGAQNLLPGAEIQKEGWVTNTKDLPVLVRVHIEEVWGNERVLLPTTEGVIGEVQRDDKLTQAAIDNKVALIDTALKQEDFGKLDYTSENWELIGDYYYYKKVLNPGETTDLVISDVTINPDLELPEALQFSNKFFDINLTAQAVQIENYAYQSAWDIAEADQTAVDTLVADALANYQSSQEN